MLVWFVLAPLACVIMLNLPYAGAFRRRGSAVVVLLAALQIAAVIGLAAGSLSCSSLVDRYLSLNLRATNLSLALLLSVGVAVSAAALTGQSLLTDTRRREHFISVLLISLVGMNGAVLVTDLFSLYVFIEAASISSFVLIALHRDKDALEGAFKYLIMSVVATVLMLASVALLLMITGGTDFDTVAAALKTSPNAMLAKIACGAFVCGLFIKGGLVPFHGWVLGAYSAASAPVSVLLAGATTKAAGVYALLRLATSVFPAGEPLNQVLMAVGTASIIIGALAAIGQTDTKRMLAYSSISQVGYIILGLGCGTALGVAAAIFHLFNHAVFKSLLFVNSAAVEQRTGTTDTTKLGGLGSQMPVTGLTSVVGILSTAGIPPFAGFWSKLLIVVALWQSGRSVYAALAVLFSVVTLAYLLLWQRRVFFGKTPESLAGVREASGAVLAPEIILAGLTTALGLAFPWLINTFLLPINGPF